ncbi:MAG: TonB-dependent receptor [Mariniphaga sp.]|nr:TonB-dependent receptor [Mariniphaga sp.]
MKRSILIILLILLVCPVLSQPKTRGKVKRKYRNVERVEQMLPPVYFRGLVRDAARTPIPGASVEIEGLNRLVHTNERGEFLLSDLPTSRLRIRVSCLGYLTKIIDYEMQQGYNDHYIALDRGPVPLEYKMATTLNREQHIPDIPGSVSVIKGERLQAMNLEPIDLATSVPGLWLENHGAGYSGLALQGSNGFAGFPGFSPTVAVFSDQVPVMQPTGVPVELFDLERVEVYKGTQNILFGRNALDGAVLLLSRKPENQFGGYVTAGAGSYGDKEVGTALNFPFFKERLLIRAAGVYRDRDGLLKNLAGGRLNGKNTLGGRVSVRLIPAPDHQADLQLNYQKNEFAGTGFLNPWFPDDYSTRDVYDSGVILNRGKELGTEQQLTDATLTYRLFRDEHNYWTSVSSFRRTETAAAWDADGSHLPALEMDHHAAGELFFQELRYNFMRKSRSNGSAGVNFLQEKNNFSHALSSNDQYIYDLLTDPGNFVLPDRISLPVNPQPFNPFPLAGIPLSGDHHETVHARKTFWSAQAYFHLTCQLYRKVFFTGGIRALYERMKYVNDFVYSDGMDSSFGPFTGAQTNLLYSPTSSGEVSKGNFSIVGQAGFTFRQTENFNFYLQAIHGRKPHVLLITPDGTPEIVLPEKSYSLEAGWKTLILKQFFWEAHGFYRQHNSIQAMARGGIHDSGFIDSDGKGASYGMESTLKIAVVRGVDLFGKYSWLQTAFDSIGVEGELHPYAGNSFPLSPEHSLTCGGSARVNIAHRLKLFVTPWYSWKSHFWFTSANTSGLEQKAYGLLHINCGVELEKPDVVLTLFSTNLFNQPYLAGAGHWGGIFGLPTYIPGAPRMSGVRLTYHF